MTNRHPSAALVFRTFLILALLLPSRLAAARPNSATSVASALSMRLATDALANTMRHGAITESGHEFRKERGEAASPPDELVSELQE